MPTSSAAREVRPAASRPNEPVSSSPATRVVAVSGQSASLPARLAASHPGHPGQAEEADDGVRVVVGRADSRKASEVHRTLKAAKAQAPCQARRRSTGSVPSRRETRSRPGRGRGRGAGGLPGQRPGQHQGEDHHQRRPRSSRWPATRRPGPPSPETVRASRIPVSRPVMIRATTRPRRSGEARSAAKGTMIWPATEASPRPPSATAKSQRSGASGAAPPGPRRPGRRRPPPGAAGGAGRPAAPPGRSPAA